VLGGEEHPPSEARDVRAAREATRVQVHVREELVLLRGDARERERSSQLGDGERRLERLETGERSRRATRVGVLVFARGFFFTSLRRRFLSGSPPCPFRLSAASGGSVTGGLLGVVEPLRERRGAGAHELAQRAKKLDAVHVEDA
jgi:hypothetical protein